MIMMVARPIFDITTPKKKIQATIAYIWTVDGSDRIVFIIGDSLYLVFGDVFLTFFYTNSSIFWW